MAYPPILFRQVCSSRWGLWSDRWTRTSGSCRKLSFGTLVRFDSLPNWLRSSFTVGSLLLLMCPRMIPAALELVVFFSFLRSTALLLSGTHSKCAGLTLLRPCHPSPNEDFHISAAPGDDLIRSIVRGGQRRCNCDASQKYMRACVKFLILKHIFLYGIACWAQS